MPGLPGTAVNRWRGGEPLPEHGTDTPEIQTQIAALDRTIGRVIEQLQLDFQ